MLKLGLSKCKLLKQRLSFSPVISGSAPHQHRYKGWITFTYNGQTGCLSWKKENIYILSNVFHWLREIGGLERKQKKLCIDKHNCGVFLRGEIKCSCQVSASVTMDLFVFEKVTEPAFLAVRLFSEYTSIFCHSSLCTNWPSHDHPSPSYLLPQSLNAPSLFWEERK